MSYQKVSCGFVTSDSWPTAVDGLCSTTAGSYYTCRPEQQPSHGPPDRNVPRQRLPKPKKASVPLAAAVNSTPPGSSVKTGNTVSCRVSRGACRPRAIPHESMGLSHTMRSRRGSSATFRGGSVNFPPSVPAVPVIPLLGNSDDAEIYGPHARQWRCNATTRSQSRQRLDSISIADRPLRFSPIESYAASEDAQGTTLA